MALSEARYRDIIAVYPQQGGRRWLFKAPLYAWRLGLGALMPPTFVLLTTRGRKSGLPRRTMVESTLVDGNYYVISAWGERADWLKNIEADPNVTLQVPRVGAFGGKAARCTDEAHFRRVFQHFQRSPAMKPYLEQLGIPFTLEAFLENKDRIFLVIITPLADLPLPPQNADWAWVWAVVAALLALARLVGRPKVVRSA
jgi:deazaflavin-dependent oxidoreductase (nitroreductase family)